MNLDTVVNGLKSKEIDLKMNRPSSNQYEVKSVRGISRYRNSFHKRHSKETNKKHNSSESSDNGEVAKDKDRRCYNCGKKGHFIKDSKSPKRFNKKKETNVVIEEEESIVY